MQTVLALTAIQRASSIDRNAISPSLFNPTWDDLANFVYILDFDLGVGADFMPEAVLSSTNGCSNDGSISAEQLKRKH